MKKSKSNQLELNFDEENKICSKDNHGKTLKEIVDYSFDDRLTKKKHISDMSIYKEIILLAKHI